MNDLSITRALPNRRQSLRMKRVFADPHGASELKLYVTAGIDPADGKIAEVFARSSGAAGKNSTMHRMLDDAAVLISHLLQRGMTLADIAHALGSESPIGDIVAAARELQAEIDAWPPGANRLDPGEAAGFARSSPLGRAS